MNKKLLATAVAASLAVPVAANAAEVYGRVNNALSMFDSDAPGADTVWDQRNVSSRFGLKGSSDLDNGMTVGGRYEFSTFTDREGNTDGRGGVNDTRLGWVELSGDFGSVKIGNQWSAFFNAVGTYMSPTFSLGYYLGSSIGTKPLRTSNTIKYSNSVGPVSFAIDARISSDGAGGDLEKNISRDRGEDIDGIGIGVSFAVNDSLTIGLAVDSDFYDIDPDTGLNRDDDDRIAVGASYAWGDHHVDVAWYSIDEGVKSGVQGRDEDTASIYYHGTWGMNKLMVGYLIADDGPNAEPSQLTLNFYHKMGGGFQTYVESAWVDADNGPTFGNDFNHIILGMRYDF